MDSYRLDRVKKPLEADWNKLVKVLGSLKGTRDDVLTLEKPAILKNSLGTSMLPLLYTTT